MSLLSRIGLVLSIILIGGAELLKGQVLGARYQAVFYYNGLLANFVRLSNYSPEANPDAWASFNSIGYFFDGLGVLVHRKLIDISLVDDLMSSSVIWLWARVIWEWVEYLYNCIRENDGEVERALTTRETLRECKITLQTGDTF